MDYFFKRKLRNKNPAITHAITFGNRDSADLEIWKLLEISMDVIGQLLELLDADWLTFGNLNLEHWEMLSARMTRKFVKRSKFFYFYNNVKFIST